MRSNPLLASLALLSLAVFFGPARPDGVGSAQEQKEPKQPASQAEQPAEWIIPDEEKNRKNPIEATAESLEIGRKLFSSQCVMCHGEKGDGQGDLAQEMKLSVPDFTDPAVQKKRTDGELHFILAQGHGRMPGQGKRLREEQRWHLVNAIRKLAPAAAPRVEEKKK